MTYILTFVASDVASPVSKKHFREAEKIMKAYGAEPNGDMAWLAKDMAADMPVSERPGSVLLAHLRDMLGADKIDLFSVPAANRRKKLLLADMDSTIVTGETLDDLAEFAGIKDQIAAITARAMEGKLDFEAALRERVGLLRGLPETALEQTLARTQLSPGATTLVNVMKTYSATCVLVSGGFTYFTGTIAAQVGFDHHHGNTLEVANAQLAGTVGEPILDKHAKVRFLEHYAGQLGIGLQDCMTIGDGANDVPMLKKAGLGIGYRPKKTVADTVDNIIVHGDLSAALYAQGYSADDLQNIVVGG